MQHFYSAPITLINNTSPWMNVVADPDGISVHAVGHENGNFKYRRSDDQGKTWPIEVIIQSGGVTDPVLERPLAITDSGVLVAAYLNGNNLEVKRSTDNGATWSNATVIHTRSGTGQFYRLAMEASGETIHFVYNVLNNGTTVPYWRGVMYYRKSTDAGATWSNAVEPYPNGVAYESASRPGLCVNGDVVHITWAALRTGDTILTNEEINTGRSTDAGATWESRVIHKTNSATYAHRPDIITDTTGVILLVWQESLDGGGPGDLDLQMKRSIDDGANWAGPVRMTNTLNESEHAVLALDGNRAVILWADRSTGTQRPTIRYSNDAGATWNPLEIVTTSYITAAPSVTLSRDFVHIFSNSDGGDNLVRATRSWFDVTEPVETNLLEDFEGAAQGPPPNANWTNGVLTNVAGEGIVRDGSGRGTRKSTGGYRQGSYYSAATFGPDVDLVLELDSLPDTLWDGFHFGLGFTWGAGNTDGYSINAERGNTGFDFYNWRIANTATTSLGQSPVSPTLASGDKIALQRRGDLLRMLYKPSAGSWTILFEATDATYDGLEGNPFFELVANQSCRARNIWATTISDEPPPPETSPATFVRRHGASTDNLTSQSYTWVDAIAATVPVGNRLIMVMDFQDGIGAAAVTDPRGNTWTRIFQGAGGTNANLTVMECKVTTQLEIGDDLTITKGVSSRPNSYLLFEITSAEDYVNLSATSTGTGTICPITYTPPAGPAGSGGLAIFAQAKSLVSTYTYDADFTEILPSAWSTTFEIRAAYRQRADTTEEATAFSWLNNSLYYGWIGWWPDAIVSEAPATDDFFAFL